MSARDEKKSDSSEEDDEEVKVVLTQNLLRVDEVFVYAVPPMKTSGGHRAEDWNLAKPAATCALNLVRRDNTLLIRLMGNRPREGGPKGATEEFLFAQCRIVIVIETDAAAKRENATPGVEYWVESVVDSSRYFVVRCEDEKTNRQAFVGVGFRERSDATNFKMGMSDFMRAMDRERRAAELAASGGGGSGEDGEAAEEGSGDDEGVPSVSKLSLREGEKIHVNLGGQGRRREERRTQRTNGVSASHASVSAVGTGGLLLRPPPPPAGAAAAASAAEGEKAAGERPCGDDDGRAGGSSSSKDDEKSADEKAPPEAPDTSGGGGDGDAEEDWGDFESG